MKSSDCEVITTKENFQKEFKFSHIFDENATQEEVFKEIAPKPLEDFLEKGISTSIFASGVVKKKKCQIKKY